MSQKSSVPWIVRHVIGRHARPTGGSGETIPPSVEAGNVYLDTPARPLSDVANKDSLPGSEAAGRGKSWGEV